jgi:hypothetical protein
MAKDTEKDTTRVQLELSPKSYETLIELKVITDATSYAEVVKRALRLYSKVIEKQNAGHRMQFVDPDGKVTEYEVLY